MSRYKAYPKYRDFGVACLGQIPPHWAISKLRYKFSFGKGLTITKENLEEDGIPCVNYGEVHSKFGFEVNPTKHLLKCVDESYLKAFSNCLLRKGDFVFADTSEDLDGSGNFTQLTSDTVTFAGYHTIIARPVSRKNTRYLAYLFDAKEFRTQIRLAVKGVKVFSITQAILRDADIWLPSDDEQKNIAAFLDHETAKIDALIEKQQRLIELLKEKRQAVISHAVTKGLNPDAPMKDSGVEWLGEVPAHWHKRQLKYLCTYNDEALSETVGADYEIEYVDIGSVSAINGISGTETLLFGDAPSRARRIVRDGDILISTVRTYLEAIASVQAPPNNLIASTGFAVIRPNLFLHKGYAAYCLRASGFIKEVVARSVGVSYPAINASDLVNIKNPEPSIAEQENIAAFLDHETAKIDALIEKQQRLIELLKEKRQAVISHAVTGKIDVRDWLAAA